MDLKQIIQLKMSVEEIYIFRKHLKTKSRSLEVQPDPGAPWRLCEHCWKRGPKKNPEGSWGSHPAGTTDYLDRKQPGTPQNRQVSSENPYGLPVCLDWRCLYRFHQQCKLKSLQLTPALAFVWLEKGCGTNSLL